MFNLLSTQQTGGGSIMPMLIIFVVFIGGMMFFSYRSQKKRQKETEKMLNSLQVGSKIKTIGGICGVIVELCEDNTVVVETGSETNKSYMKFDKQAVYPFDNTQTVAQEEAQPQEELAEESVAEETPFEETQPTTEEEKKD